MKVLVTGGCGFIGSNFIHLLLAETDYKIFNLDCLTYAAHPGNLAGLENNPRYAFLKADICNTELVHEYLQQQQIDAIVHFAAESHVDRSIENASDFVRTNVLGTQSLIDAARKTKLKRFVHVSTDEVYGSLQHNDAAFSETTPLHPNSPYSASKAASDMLVLAAHHTSDFPALITRCSNNYGPRQFPEKLIPLVLHRALERQSIPVYGNGTNIRDWIYVEDHCKGILDVLNSGKLGEVYNFGGAAEHNNLDVVKTLLKLTNRSEDLITFVTDRPGHDFRYAINFSKATLELGWKPATHFESGLQKTVDWYFEHQEWVKHATGEHYQHYYQQHYGK
ncbi:MAG: dTDP-glucose 4,6-dehydratase [Deltaproteobacteria bacterium CG_4_10_14_0_2_um_filter_43_8]|nr:MAG: dTDP-glucose 4,6-dehydratase [Deltaproteobacteria bacterium CG11_big_fil_rev_8_21_14_0_20_42_23]PJA21637.1 MAG: dTDP-glucose 4,6-dehydratase [Deltaproteobacteria bacterium CG_4_10_14_0_2_um_filter_43_8]PJC64888.1 MAG: dTDP-glucose 4,6-dehydratase [Deltaproteobacteria bacterium CG_4_9_14_0_2_um_filter_42_21]